LIVNTILLKETLYYSFSKAIPGVVGFFSVIIFMRMAGSSEYGEYSFLLSQCNLIVALGYGWLNQAQLRYFSLDNHQNHYINNQIRALISSFLFCLLILSILVLIQSLSMLIWIISIITIASMGIFNYLKTLYQVKILPKKIVFQTSFQSLLGLLLALALMQLIGTSKISLLLGLTLSFIITILIIIRNKTKILSSFFRNYKKNDNQISYLRKWFIYGSPLSLWFAIGLALSYLDRFFINYYLTSFDLGIYASIQELLIRSFSLTLFPFIMALHPRIMNLWNKSMTKDAVRLILNSIFLIIIVGITLSFFVWQYDDLIFIGIKKIIPEVMFQSKRLILPLFFSGFFWQLSFLTHKMLELNEQTKSMIIAIIPSLIINIIGNIYFLPKIGVLATAYTAFFSALIYCIITSIYSIYLINKMKPV
tara:strand:+ start:1070 stop:2335 length:1266 start_codon:yes stop_codon:yes gene_type:complete